MPANAKVFLPQLEQLIERGESMVNTSRHPDLSDLSRVDVAEYTTSGIAAIQRATGVNSIYSTELISALSTNYISDGYKIPLVLGGLKSLREAIVNGYLDSYEQLIHASVFADFLEMAQHLLNEGYKDAAAVLLGGTLEGHLRKLCVKNDISLEVEKSNGEIRAATFDEMNIGLAKKGIYFKVEQQNLSSWYKLRTSAAHGHYDEYLPKQVAIMLDGVTDFMARFPA